MTPNRWRLDGQLARITGASAGIGLAITRELLGFGADVMLVARDADALEVVRDELLDEFPDRGIHAMAADVANDEDRRESPAHDPSEQFGGGHSPIVTPSRVESFPNTEGLDPVAKPIVPGTRSPV